jgi:poly(A) polymerase Pap1
MKKKKKVVDINKSDDSKKKIIDIKINEFGELVRDYNIDDVNIFLNENVDDKKLRDKK